MSERIRKSLYFTDKKSVEIREEPFEPPAKNQVLVKTQHSAISAGTELLIYHGQISDDVQLDETIDNLETDARYPFKYGYALTGKIVGTGKEIRQDLVGKHVFAFHPHESHFVASPDELIILPQSMNPEDSVFLANMETAVNFLMDGQPLPGEAIGIFGQGVVGLLTTSLLSAIPQTILITSDIFPARRKLSVEAGADYSIDPNAENPVEKMRHILQTKHALKGLDLVFELSGSPDVLNDAIHTTGYEGRIVVGSWYGDNTAHLHLDTYFHRNKIRIISSQVSKIPSALRGRWNKERRLKLALELLRQIQPSRFITHRFTIDEAPAAYRNLSQAPEHAVQVLLTYD